MGKNDKPTAITDPAASKPDTTEAPRRRTPTYNDVVRAPGEAAEGRSEEKRAESAPDQSGDKAADRSTEKFVPAGGAARTRIGLPPVTVLPSQARQQAQAREAAQPAPADPERPVITTALAPFDPGRMSRETLPMHAAEARGGRGGPPVVVSAVRIEGAQVEGLVPHRPPPSRGRKIRPATIPAEVLATKHVVPAKRDWRLVILDNKLVPQAASIRSLRHRIAEKGDPRVILVTSATAGEGKTFCAVNLALALAELKRSRVLLLEANVYEPTVAELFAVSEPPCVLEQIEGHRGRLEAPWRVLEMTTFDLHVLAISPKTSAPLVLDGPQLVASLDSLRGAYDYIVVDGPSMDAGAEVPLIQDAVDGVVLATRSDRSRAKALRYALDQITPNDVVGVVLVEI